MSDITWTNEIRKLRDLKPWSRNPRQINKDQAKRLAESFDEFGQVETIAIGPENEVYNGHQRLSVLLDKHGKDYEVEVRVSSRALTEKEREKLTVFLHKGAAGEWNFDMLANEFEVDELVEWGFSPEELGIEVEKETKDAEPQIDRAAELNEKWQVKTGDLWQIGEHRLLCGDSTKREDVEKIIDEMKSEMCFTSPPYNAGVSAKLRGNTSIDDNLYGEEYNDNQTEFDYLDLLNKFTDNAIENCKYVFVNIQVLSGNKHAFIEYLFTHSDKFCDVAIWDKQHAAPAAAQRVMDSRFEFILVFGGNGSRAIGTRDFRGMVHNVYSGNPQRHNENADVHAATFPIDFPEYFIKTFTNENESIYEPFAGTGTTMVACQNLSRKCRAIEISPNYCAVILERMATAFPDLEIRKL